MQFKNLEQFLCVNFDQTFLSPNTGGKHSAQEDIPKLRFWLLVFQSLNLNHAELLILVLNVKGPLFYSFVFFFNSSQKLINHIFHIFDLVFYILNLAFIFSTTDLNFIPSSFPVVLYIL